MGIVLTDTMRIVINDLYEGCIGWSDAAEKLGMTDDELGHLLDEYHWMPSPKRIKELCDMEMESLQLLRKHTCRSDQG